MNYTDYNDKRDWNEYFEFLSKVWTECGRVLKHEGRICVNIQPFWSDYIPAHHIISHQLQELGLLWKAEIIWDKHHYNAAYTAWGSWKSPSSPYFKYTWEFIEVFCKGSRMKKGDESDLTGDEFKEWVFAKWDIGTSKHPVHPATFPRELPLRLIKLFSYVGDIVLDPFCGIGTTLLAAQALDRKYIGIEISEQYCKLAEEVLLSESIKLF